MIKTMNAHSALHLPLMAMPGAVMMNHGKLALGSSG
jgi:hypothetical protein